MQGMTISDISSGASFSKTSCPTKAVFDVDNKNIFTTQFTYPKNKREFRKRYFGTLTGTAGSTINIS